MKLKRMKLDDLQEAPYNPRTATSEALAGLQASVSRFGCVEPVVWNRRTRHVVGGHQRLKVLRAMGETATDVVVLDLPLSEEKALNVALNNEAIQGEWSDGLEALLAEIHAETPDLYDELLLAELAEGEGGEATGDMTDPEPQIDRAAELQATWQTAAGQLWVIPGKAGEHRLLCGDSTKAEDVGRLMGDVRAWLMNTDPPYGVGYANDERPNPGVAKPRVANDSLQDEKLQAFLEAVFRAAVDVALQKNAAWYLWHAHLTQGFFAAAAAAAANVVLHRQIIWVKSNMLLTRGQYHWKHEPCFMGWVKGCQPPDYGRGNGERDQTTVWEIPSIPSPDRKAYNHATPKPVGLFTGPITKHLKPSEACYEPFAGSGPQFVAAENLGRVCYGLEIEPKYVAVILQRLADMGLEPRLAS